MKTVLSCIMLFVVCAIQAYASPEWTKISLPTQHRYYSMDFINEHTGFIGATEGAGNFGPGHIYKTINGGLNWTSVLMGNMVITSLVHEGNLACAIGHRTTDSLQYTSATYYSTDAGDNWTLLPFVTDAVCSDVAIKDGIIYVGSYMGAGLYHTTNFGASWETDLQNSWSILALTKKSEFLYATSEASIYSNTSGTWAEDGPHGIRTWGRSTVVNPLNQRLYIGGFLPSEEHGAIAWTQNGKVWNVDTLRKAYVTTLAFNERGDAYAGGMVYEEPNNNRTCIWKKTNNGWTEDTDFNDLLIEKIVAAGNAFYAAGTLELYKHSTLTGLQPNQNSIPDHFVLRQNYPNPFNPTTKITFSLPKNTMVSLKVFNLVGKEVATLVNGQQNAGEHSVDFNGANFSSGIYFYRLSTDEFTETKKMILVK